MELFKLTINGSSMITKKVPTEEIEYSLEIGEKAIIEKIEMSQEEFENLPEFDGF